jgi:2,3-bisphosphoglycerate-independent phosphoglycerate mutase
VSIFKRPLVLTILDGWGYRAETANNAIALAKKPTYDKLLREYPNTLIQASDCPTGRWATAKSAT